MAFSLYKDILGNRYDILPPAVRRLHDSPDNTTYGGVCTVKRGTNVLATLFATILSLPKSAENIPVTVNFTARNNKEYWHRDFNGDKFRSIQWHHKGLLYERLNLTTLVFRIDASDHMLDLVLQRVYVMGLPVMRVLNPRVVARETEMNGKFHFFIQTSLPVLGLLIQYEGDLERIS